MTMTREATAAIPYYATDEEIPADVIDVMIRKAIIRNRDVVCMIQGVVVVVGPHTNRVQAVSLFELNKANIEMFDRAARSGISPILSSAYKARQREIDAFTR